VNSSISHAGHSWPAPGIRGSPVHSPVINRLSQRRSMFRCLIQVIVELINLLTIIHSPSPRLAATHTSDAAASLLTGSSEALPELPSAAKTCRSSDSGHSAAVPTDHDTAPYRPQTPCIPRYSTLQTPDALQTTIQHPTDPRRPTDHDTAPYRLQTPYRPRYSSLQTPDALQTTIQHPTESRRPTDHDTAPYRLQTPYRP